MQACTALGLVGGRRESKAAAQRQQRRKAINVAEAGAERLWKLGRGLRGQRLDGLLIDMGELFFKLRLKGRHSVVV